MVTDKQFIQEMREYFSEYCLIPLETQAIVVCNHSPPVPEFWTIYTEDISEEEVTEVAEMVHYQFYGRESDGTPLEANVLVCCSGEKEALRIYGAIALRSTGGRA